MKKVLALLLAVDRAEDLGVLTHYGPKAALPYGGLYRFIDFALSNLLHSDIFKVAVLFQYRSDSLIKHIGSGTAWEMVGGDREITMLPPTGNHYQSQWYKGDADAIFQNLEYIRAQEPDYVLIITADNLYCMNFMELIAFHEKCDSEITMAFAESRQSTGAAQGFAEIDDEYGEQGGRLKNYRNFTNGQVCDWGTMSVFLFDPDILYSVLYDYVADQQLFQFNEGIISSLINRNRVYAYKYRGYWDCVKTIDNYYQVNLNLMKKSKRLEVQNWQIRTNLENERISARPATLIRPKAKISNSIIYNGCDINGQVENSIIFSGATIQEGALVKNSIIMFDSTIEQDVKLEQVIVDVEVNVGSGSLIGIHGKIKPNILLPHSLNSGVTVIGRNSYIPKNILIEKNCIIYPNLDEGDFFDAVVESGSTIE